ncbi:hypothetical protein ES705_30038 [subsurface metagenome]
MAEVKPEILKEINTLKERLILVPEAVFGFGGFPSPVLRSDAEMVFGRVSCIDLSVVATVRVAEEFNAVRISS